MNYGYTVIIRSTFLVRYGWSISKTTLLFRLGGSVSTGRTLLWILVSVFAVSQVRETKIYDVRMQRIIFT